MSWKDKPRYTLDYAPPELLKDPNVVTYSPAVDVYGLGATLYTMLVGHAPYRLYQGDTDHGPDVHHKLRKRMEKETFNQTSKRWLTASPQFKQLVSWCLQRDPSKRPQLSDILDSEWLLPPSLDADPDVDIVPMPEQIVVDLSEDTMEQPTAAATQSLAESVLQQQEDQLTAKAEELPQQQQLMEEEFVIQEIFDSDFEATSDFLGFDENAPPLRLPDEYYVELPLPAVVTEMPPPPPPPVAAAAAPADEVQRKRPRTRQQRRTELRQTAGTPPEPEDSKAALYLLMQQLAPPVEVEFKLPLSLPYSKPRRLPAAPRAQSLDDQFNGFSKVKSTWRKSRASWRHFCLLLNGLQQVLKKNFKKQRRVYYPGPSIKAERLDEQYEKPLIFPRPRPPAQRKVKRPPKVARPPTRVQPERARALRQRYVFE